GLVKLKLADDKVTAEQVYFERGLPITIGGSVLLDGHLYGTTTDGLVCAEFTAGKVKWKDKAIGPASVIYADGRLYLHGENGDVALVEPSQEKYVEKGRFTKPDRPQQVNPGEKSSAYPALADGRLYLREQGTIWCYDVKGGK